MTITTSAPALRASVLVETVGIREQIKDILGEPADSDAVVHLATLVLEAHLSAWRGGRAEAIAEVMAALRKSSACDVVDRYDKASAVAQQTWGSD
jgi:hypothetical protein